MKPTLERINKEIEKLTDKNSKNIELFEDGILDKSEFSKIVKAINDDIEKLKYREQELKQDLQLAEGDPIPFEVVNEVMQRFKEVFLDMSTSQQRKQLIHLLVSKITINKEREIDSIEIQINDDVITYLIKDRLPKEQTTVIHLFRIKYGHIIRYNKYTPKEILKYAKMQESYQVEINKGIKLVKYVIVNE